MRSARASRPPLRVAAESSRIARTVRRIVFSGRRRYSTNVRSSSSASVGTRSGVHGAGWPVGRKSRSTSRIEASILAPDAPSMVAWWTLVSWAISRPSSTPSIT